MAKSKKKAVYDPVSKRMVLVEWPGHDGSGEGGDGASRPGDLVAYRVMGRQLRKLIEYAQEDGLDIAGSGGRTAKGLAVNSYVAVAIDEFIDAREAARSEAARERTRASVG